MHFLQPLRCDETERHLSELRRKFRCATHSAIDVAEKISGVRQAHSQQSIDERY
jgi:hypothetical protein